MQNAVGSIVIEIRDAKTLEIKDTISANNVITAGQFLQTMCIQNGTYNNWHSSSYNGRAYPMPQEIAVSGRVIKPANKSLGYRASGWDYTTSTTSPAPYTLKVEDTTVQNWVFTDAAIPFIERKARFNSPTQIDTINSIFLCNDADQNTISSAIALVTPCVQNPGEVLDIT